MRSAMRQPQAGPGDRGTSGGCLRSRWQACLISRANVRTRGSIACSGSRHARRLRGSALNEVVVVGPSEVFAAGELNAVVEVRGRAEVTRLSMVAEALVPC